jgi:hypothetical protein
VSFTEAYRRVFRETGNVYHHRGCFRKNQAEEFYRFWMAGRKGVSSLTKLSIANHAISSIQQKKEVTSKLLREWLFRFPKWALKGQKQQDRPFGPSWKNYPAKRFV